MTNPINFIDWIKWIYHSKWETFAPMFATIHAQRQGETEVFKKKKNLWPKIFCIYLLHNK